jgi:hypothetical protein
MMLSVFYLALALGTMLVQPFVWITAVEVLSVSSLWLGPVQGLVGLALGAVFGSKRESE